MRINKICVVFIVLGFLVYFNFLLSEFVWDTKIGIEQNIATHLNIFHSLDTVFSQKGGTGYYRPVGYFYSATEFTIFGANPFLFHLLSLLIHIGNVWLFFLFLKSFFKQKLSFFLALVFLIHPMNIESIQYLDLLYTFGLFALLIARSSFLKIRSFFLIMLLLILAAFSKETGILFIFILLIYRFLFAKKQKYLFFFSAGFVLSLYIYIRTFSGKAHLSLLSIYPITQLSFGARLLTIPGIIFYYLKTFFFPRDLIIDQQWVVTSLNFANFWLPLFYNSLFLICVLAFGFYLFKANKKSFRIFLFFTCWFCISMIFNLQLFPLDMTVADRWFYLPMMGVIGMLGIVLQQVQTTHHSANKYCLIGAVCIVLLLSIRTFERNKDWHDSMTLFSHDGKISKNFDLENYLTQELLDKGKIHEAIIHAQKSTSIYPYETNLGTLGNMYQAIGDMTKAKIFYEKALQITSPNPYFPHKHHLNLYLTVARFLDFNATPETAITFINKALDDYPSSAPLYFYLTYSYLKKGDNIHALASAKKAYMIAPNRKTKFIYFSLLEHKQIPLQ